ncbi:hypothetical protein HRG64_14090 [Enterococcus faecalis]|nr:hypothetical protein [Enterococcus faecalis]
MILRKIMGFLSWGVWVLSVFYVATKGWQLLGDTVYVATKNGQGRLSEVSPFGATYDNLVPILFLIFILQAVLDYVLKTQDEWATIKRIVQRISRYYGSLGLIALLVGLGISETANSEEVPLLVTMLVQYLLIRRFNSIKDEQLKQGIFPLYPSKTAYTANEWLIHGDWQPYVVLAGEENKRCRKTTEELVKGKWHTAYTIPSVQLLFRFRYTPFTLSIHLEEIVPRRIDYEIPVTNMKGVAGSE